MSLDGHEYEMGRAAARALLNGQPAPVNGQPAPALDRAGRVAAIFGLREAKGLEALAQHLAFHTDMTVEQATATLRAASADDHASGAAAAKALLAAAGRGTGQ